MSQRVFQVPTFTATPTADAGTALTSATYLAIAPVATSNRCEVTEIYMGGQATTALVCCMVFARHSTIGATLTTLAAPNSDGPMDNLMQPVTSACRGYVAATTPPQRSASISDARLALTYNAFGGIVRWMQNKGYGWFMTGTSVTAGSQSESSLSSKDSGGSAAASMSAHIIYEQV